MKKNKTAAKILSLFMAVLMVVGVCPFVFAADGDIAIKWPTAAREIEYGQTVADAGISDDGEAKIGDVIVDGHFEYTYPEDVPQFGQTDRDAKFIPDDTNISPIDGYIQLTVIQSKSAVLEGGLPVASPIQAGQKLSDSTIDKLDIKLMNYGESIKWKCSWKEPDKVMDTAGTYTEILECYPSTSANKKKIASIDVEIEIVVEGGADTIAVVERPTASQIEIGQTLADSTLTGGAVTKGGNPVAGTFAWKDSTIAPTAGTREYTVVFTPDDSSVCEPQEMQVSVTTVRPEMKLTWPEVKGHYKANAVVKDCVTLTGGEANIEGEFRITEESKYMRIPASITDSMEIELIFIPKDLVNYTYAYKTVTVSFEPAEPNCDIGYRVSGDKRSYEINAFLRNDENWDIKTGKFYLVLDGEKIELDEAFSSLDYDYNTLGAGNHTIQAVYEPGENDFYVKGESETVEFSVDGFYNVNVTDFAGTTSQDYLPGKTVTVTAQPHEKSYYDFSGWTVEGVELTDEEKAQQSVTFEMPENEVNLTANYKFNFCNFVKAVFEKIGQVLLGIINQGIAWLKDAIQNIPRP